MKVRELVALLQRADPEWEVLDEFEGDISSAIEAHELRVGEAQLVELIPADLNRPEAYTSWCQVDPDPGHQSELDALFAARGQRILRRERIVVLAEGSHPDPTEDKYCHWPERLDALPQAPPVDGGYYWVRLRDEPYNECASTVLTCPLVTRAGQWTIAEFVDSDSIYKWRIFGDRMTVDPRSGPLHMSESLAEIGPRVWR